MPHEQECKVEVNYDDTLHKCTVIILTRQRSTKQQKKKSPLSLSAFSTMRATTNSDKNSTDWVIQSVVVIDSNANSSVNDTKKSNSRRNENRGTGNTKKKSKVGNKIDHTTNRYDLHRPRSPKRSGRRSALDLDRSVPCDGSVSSNDSQVPISSVSCRRRYRHRRSNPNLGPNERRSRSWNNLPYHGGLSCASSFASSRSSEDELSIQTSASLRDKIQNFTLFSSKNQEFDLGHSKSRNSLEGMSLKFETPSQRPPKITSRRTSTKKGKSLRQRFRIFPVAEEDSITEDNISDKC